MALFSETADVSVRPAVPGDEAAMTRVQVSAWRTAHAETLGDAVVDLLDEPRMAAQWATAITEPPGPGFAVLVACAGPVIVGFAAVTPGQILALEVEPSAQRQGHGSRLLSAAVDRLRSDGSAEIVTWILDGDDAREQFFSGAGLGPSGRSRTLAAGEREVREQRWSAEL